VRKIALSRREIDPKDFLRREAREDDADTLYSEPGVYTIDGKPSVIYGRFNDRYDRVLGALRTMTWTTGSFSKQTLEGLETRNFGFCTRRVTRDYCHPASLAVKDPSRHAVLAEFGRLLDAIYTQFAPETAERHSELLRQVRADWIMPGTRFTSGIINNSNALPYHYDRGNFEGVFSCMAVFRNLCEGGNLVMPELGAKFLIEDNSFVLFDGQDLVHGVTPIVRLNKKAYRYSLVYYSRKGMCKCGSPEEEINRIRRVKREREWKRV
jgi:hypothetical protein